MPKPQRIGPYLLHLLLLMTTLGFTANLGAIDLHPAPPAEQQSLALNHSLRWREAEATGPRCFEVHVPSPGAWWLELRTTRPATTPALWVLGQDGDDSLAMLERIDGMLIHVHRRGDYVVCLTSQAPLGEVVVVNAFEPVEDEDGSRLDCSFYKDGDDCEIEVPPDP